MRLFTALWLPCEVRADLEAALAEAPGWPPKGWRATPADRWHVTLCFHGDAEPGPLARRLDAALAESTAPVLRLAGAVSFRGVLGARVVPADRDAERALAVLVGAAGADPADFRGHVTLARGPRGRGATPVHGPPAGYQGPRWTAGEVCLVRSELGSGPPRYTTVHRVGLRPGHRTDGARHPPNNNC